MFGLGDGIIIGCSILCIFGIVIRFFPKNNPGKFVTEKTCDDRFKIITDGIDGLRGDVQGIHKRIDMVLAQGKR